LVIIIAVQRAACETYSKLMGQGQGHMVNVHLPPIDDICLAKTLNLQSGVL